MQNKVFVIVSVPLIEEEFEMYIPTTKKIGTVKNLIIKIVEENSLNNFKDNGCKNLYDKLTGEKIDEQQFVKYSNIKNGTRLILY